MPVRLYCSAAGDDPGSLDTIAAPWSTIDADWYGRPLIDPFRFRLETSADQSGAVVKLTAAFHVPLPPLPRADAAPGTFVEGLWNYDAAEVFLLDQAGAPYVELNLSPYGEWWACRFASYRKGRTPAPTIGVSAQARITDSGWTGKLTLPLRDLEATGVNFAGMQIHVAAILGPGAERRYLSSKPIAGIDPDFHRVEAFAAPEVVFVEKSRS